MKSEIIKRLCALLLNGFTVKEVKLKLLAGDITSKEISESRADSYLKEALDFLDTDVGQDLKLQYSRLINLYKLCLDKKDYTNALKTWKEIQLFSGADESGEVTITFVK